MKLTLDDLARILHVEAFASVSRTLKIRDVSALSNSAVIKYAMLLVHMVWAHTAHFSLVWGAAGIASFAPNRS